MAHARAALRDSAAGGLALVAAPEPSSGVTEGEVRLAYQLLLSRLPESDYAIAIHRQLPDVDTLCRTLATSDEGKMLGPLVTVPRRWVAAAVMGGRYLMWIDLGDRYISFDCLRDNYEPIETRFVREILKPGDVVVDIGANLGWYTLLACSRIGPNGQVHAFEPNPDTAARFAQTLTLNGLDGQVTLYKCALDENAGSVTIAWYAGSNNPGGTSIATDIAPGMTAAVVETRSLDSLGLERLDFIKIDVEGAELRVFRGGAATLRRCRPVILSELHPGQLQHVSGSSAEVFFAELSAIGYHAHIVGSRRSGERLTAFPEDWPYPLMNLALVPIEYPPERLLRAFAAARG